MRYIEKVKIKNIKCFKDVTLEFNPGWNSIQALNGDGKTTLLQILSAAFLGPINLNTYFETDNLTRKGCEKGSFEITLSENTKLEFLVINQKIIDPISLNRKYFYDYLFAELFVNEMMANFKLINMAVKDFFNMVYCGYGPICSFVKGDNNNEPFKSLFYNTTSLVNPEKWLMDMERKALKAGKNSNRECLFKEALDIFIRLLPDISEIRMEDYEVLFKYHDDYFNYRQLGEGYIKIIILISDILHQIEKKLFPSANSFRQVKGIIFVDGFDEFISGEWKYKLIYNLTKIFPHIQFITTTYKVPSPGHIIDLERKGNEVV